MCGIVGLTLDAGARASGVDAVRRMANSIVHRGPDDEGIHAADQVVLGMRRLSIIDLAGGHQPIANEDETVWVVCNGEIYNFQAVRAELQKAGHRFRTGSDVEVLLHLYEEHGERFVDHVSGMFAAALWDQKRRRLILVRDRLGIKPLYYTQFGGRLAFGSEIKALLTLPQVRRTVDRQALQEYLSLGYAVAPNTIFEGIRKLPPASMLIWTPGSEVKVETYWSPPVEVDESLSEPQWAELIRSELQRAVREHMVSDVPIGAFLSGGIDSSAVVALMGQSSGAPVNTYSIGYGGGKVAEYYNELSYAGEVARTYSTRHNEILVKPNVAALLPKLMWHLEEPISDSATTTTYLVSELAAKHVKVILSGVGGDELFAGYKRYLGDHYSRRYQRLPRWLRRQVVGPLASVLPSSRQSRMLDLARYAKKFVRASELPWREQYREFIEIQARDRLAALLTGQSSADGFDRLCGAESASDPLLRLMRVDAQTQLAEDLLLLTDKITMACSIECRVPFLDHKLVETAARIPAALKLRNGELKYVLKKALTGVLPESVLYRNKRGFGAPVGAWFKTELRPLRDELLAERSIDARGMLAWPAVREIVRAHDASEEDYTDLILVLMNLEIWSRIFIDGESPGDVGQALAERTLAA